MTVNYDLLCQEQTSDEMRNGQDLKGEPIEVNRFEAALKYRTKSSAVRQKRQDVYK